MATDAPDICALAAAVDLPCRDLEAMRAFLCDRLGFVVEMVSPADNPRTIQVAAHGLRLRLRRVASPASPAQRLVLSVDAETARRCGGELRGPESLVIEIHAHQPAVTLPPGKTTWQVARAGREAQAGRAGMRYRDLVADRAGGRYIASLIAIPDGGPVPDYVHFHRIHFQFIYCRAGWVRVVYEDQGPPFVMQAGDCVLQPPGIRHRVLEASAGLEVIEVGAPAEHETWADAALALPTSSRDPQRRFDGQGFHHHVAATARWQPLPGASGLESNDLGLSAASQGRVTADLLRANVAAEAGWRHDGDFLFLFVLAGEAQVAIDEGRNAQLARDDALSVPSGVGVRLQVTPGTMLLRVVA